MKDLTFSQAYNTNFISLWSSTIPNIRKPIISAVNGFALGGGCELAMMTDIIYCSSSATFGQPEIKLGIIPGGGGSQRLTRAIGKSRAMELILTGKNFSGTEAGQWGLAARVFESAEECKEGALKTAETVAGLSTVAVSAGKEVVNKSQELGLRDGLDYEKKVFHSLFGSKDQKIGRFRDPSMMLALLTLLSRNVCVCGEEEARMVKRVALSRFVHSHLSKISRNNVQVVGLVLGHANETYNHISRSSSNEGSSAGESTSRRGRMQQIVIRRPRLFSLPA